jgi:hypothetical protein
LLFLHGRIELGPDPAPENLAAQFLKNTRFFNRIYYAEDVGRDGVDWLPILVNWFHGD